MEAKWLRGFWMSFFGSGMDFNTGNDLWNVLKSGDEQTEGKRKTFFERNDEPAHPAAQPKIYEQSKAFLFTAF